ncbi:restriction endonuclease subunit S [Ligilactobacillus salivarius]
MDNKKNGIPKLRFPGFTGAWEQRKFNRIFIKNIEKNKGQYTFDKTISIATMHFKKEGNGASKSSLAGYKVLRVGDIAFEGHTSKKFKYGRFVMNDIGDGIMSPRFSALRPVEEISVSFWKQYIHYEPIMRKILVRSTKSGTMMNELVINDLYKESILVPSTEEQKKIGAFFNQLDSLITLHQRKLEHLQEQKKGLLQKMFPKNGEVVPEVRFPGFTDAWEQRKLGEVAHIETGKLDANAMVENGKYDFYTSGIKKYRIDIPAFKGPAITIAGNGATVGYMHLADGEFNAYQRTYVLTKFLANRHFIFSEIGNKLPRKIQQESRAGNIPYIVMDMLTDLQLFLPSIAEQEKVGELLNKLNSLITLHQRKLEHLELMKKGLLQQMFV